MDFFDLFVNSYRVALYVFDVFFGDFSVSYWVTFFEKVSTRKCIGFDIEHRFTGKGSRGGKQEDLCVWSDLCGSIAGTDQIARGD